ncbi:beta-1,4-galactosyltransferase galt-1-like [Polypterus senegalus]|uniref:beta-1,4-galactosyltransferase galt-1-like n=1 Tax=Polypterus senegalus TaxID=55291 RepID=UPI0019648B61|nr:beta-1,4-galactosyltransferase galt-1-like [Polypterus senegalus]
MSRPSFQRRLCAVFVLAFLFTLIIFFQTEWHLPSFIWAKRQPAKYLLFSSYYDDRENLNGQMKGRAAIRLIALADGDHWLNEGDRLLCHVWCGSGMRSTEARPSAFNSLPIWRYGLAHFLCRHPCDSSNFTWVKVGRSHEDPSSAVALKLLNTRRRRPPQPRVGLTVCVPTLSKNFNNVSELVQSLEMFRLLGAEKVILYKDGCSHKIQKVLDFYSREGFLKVFNLTGDSFLIPSNKWDYPKLQQGFPDLKLVVALNDCLYRTMYSNRFVVVHGLDKLFLPSTSKNWSDLVSSLRSAYPEGDIFSFLTNPLTMSGFYGIVNPQVIVQVADNSALEHRGKWVDLRGEVFTCDNRDLLQRLQEDERLDYYNLSLLENVKKVLKKGELRRGIGNPTHALWK